VFWLLLALVACAVLVVRFGVVTSGGRSFVESLLDDARLGPFGRVHVEGLEGDVWGDFTLRRLTINDAHEHGWTPDRSVCVGTGWRCCSAASTSTSATRAW
jgi:autotransporter translocation and assembly factor TamB